MPASAYQEIEAVLRQVLVLRANGSSPAAIDAMLGVASDLWSEVLAGDKPAQWPADLAAVARELGFSAVADEGAGDASKLKQLESAIDQAIVAVGGIGNVHVSCSPDRVVISGIAGDEALIAAAKLAPGMQIEDAIDVA